ncbi:hypothetical protein GWI33_023125 [Rhynchophorus ferrugineus]|uniref:Uncharacterized protein n=1 Tax=Rhynchophorus ferrugineus TaxID=354439 RepID=A0A834M1W2_RHYFE|nr:hypothetical protein GWI33_023126 [Rhynchophorus ferrugineus]KAF7264512.1 hypothetical protein GWI33_023125 [Rhynchophorus ferrugineus]
MISLISYHLNFSRSDPDNGTKETKESSRLLILPFSKINSVINGEMIPSRTTEETERQNGHGFMRNGIVTEELNRYRHGLWWADIVLQLT